MRFGLHRRMQSCSGDGTWSGRLGFPLVTDVNRDIRDLPKTFPKLALISFLSVSSQKIAFGFVLSFSLSRLLDNRMVCLYNLTTASSRGGALFDTPNNAKDSPGLVVQLFNK